MARLIVFLYGFNDQSATGLLFVFNTMLALPLIMIGGFLNYFSLLELFDRKCSRLFMLVMSAGLLLVIFSSKLLVNINVWKSFKNESNHHDLKENRGQRLISPQ